MINVALKRWLERRTYRSAHRMVTLSRAFADVAIREYGVEESKVRVVPGGVDLNTFDSPLTRREARDRLSWSQGRPTVLCVRRLVQRVGLEQLVDAMVQVAKALPDALLCIAGKGPLEQHIATRISSLGLNGSVKLLGFVRDELLPLMYKSADMTIVPSQSLEGFGLVIPESLAAGTPVLVTPVGGMPEVVADLDPNLILPDKSIGAIAEGLLQALRSPGSLPSSDRCRDYARARFDWPVIARQVLAVYREAIAARG